LRLNQDFEQGERDNTHASVARTIHHDPDQEIVARNNVAARPGHQPSRTARLAEQIR